MRILDARNIPYDSLYYDPDIRSADGAAAAMGYPSSQVFKTLVMLPGHSREILVMAPGDLEVDLRHLARAIESKSVRMATKVEAERITGLQTGGIGALALLGKGFDVYIDNKALEHEFILVNGGKRGVNVRLRARDLVAVTEACIISAGTTRSGVR